MGYCICHFLFGCCFFLVSLAFVSLLASLSDSSCCSESEDSEIRICEITPPTTCVLSRVFFLYSESISGLDALHTVHNSGFVHTLPKEQASSVQKIFLRGQDPYTLACKAIPSFDGCRTSLSVSLSLSLSLSFIPGKVRTVIPVPRGDHSPLRAARFFPPCVSLEVFATPTRRHHGRTLIRPCTLHVPLGVCTHAGS